MDNHEVRELANRLQRVEHRVFMMGMGWLLSVVLLFVFWIAAPHASSQTTNAPRVRSLAIVDQNDRTRVTIGTNDQGNGGIWLYDTTGKQRIHFGISTGGNAGAWFDDANGKTRIHVGVDFARAPEVWFADENGNERLHLGLADAQGRSQFADQPNTPQIWLVYDTTGPARLGYYALGKQRLALGGNAQGDQGIWVFDAGGKPVWSAPHGLFGGLKP